MTVQKVWIGSVGPFLYEDTDVDEDGDPFSGLKSTAQLNLGAAASAAQHAVRYDQITEAVTGVVESVIVVHNDQVVCFNGEVVTL